MPTETASAERHDDAEHALASFYPRVIEVEHELEVVTARARVDVETRDQRIDEQQAALIRAQDDNDQLRARVAQLDEQIANAHAEIHALHNSRTMRTAAVPRRIYARLRNLT